MKKLIALAAVASATAFAVPAFAATSGSVGYANYSVGDFNPGAIDGRLSSSSGIFGLEVEGAIDIQSDSKGAGTAKQQVKLSWSGGVFGTAQFDISKQFEVFARAGYGIAQFKTVEGVGSLAFHGGDVGGGVAAGVGAVYMVDPKNGVRVDYTKYDLNLGEHRATGTFSADPGTDADVWTVGYVRKFK